MRETKTRERREIKRLALVEKWGMVLVLTGASGCPLLPAAAGLHSFPPCVHSFHRGLHLNVRHGEAAAVFCADQLQGFTEFCSGGWYASGLSAACRAAASRVHEQLCFWRARSGAWYCTCSRAATLRSCGCADPRVVTVRANSAFALPCAGDCHTGPRPVRLFCAAAGIRWHPQGVLQSGPWRRRRDGALCHVQRRAARQRRLCLHHGSGLGAGGQ